MTTFEIGEQVTVNGGYLGVIVRENPPGMYEVLLARGTVCVGPTDIKKIPTTLLVDGREVLARTLDPINGLYPVTYANLKHAKEMQEKLGYRWTITGNRPYYITKIKREKI